MAKIAILGDTHLGARNDSVLFHSFYKKFYSEVFFPYLLENGIETIIQAGDLFDKKKNVNFQTLSLANEYFFDPIREYNLHLIVPVGNHDTFFKASNDINAPGLLLKNYPNALVYSKPVEVKIDGAKFLLLPWICRENEAESLELIRSTNALYAVGHLEIEGFSMYKGGRPCDHGLKMSELSKFDHVFSGHYHHRSKKGSVQYLGTPYELTWADYDDQKGFTVLDTITGEIEFVKNPFSIFHKIEYDDEGKTLEDITEIPYEKYEDTFVKVVVSSKTNPYALDVLVSNLEKVAEDVKLIQNVLALELNEEELLEVEATEEILKQVVQDTETSVPKEKLDKLLNELYIEAKSLESA